MNREEIALGMGISAPTLDKYFQHELTVGAFQKRQEVMLALQRAAKKGSVSAAKAYFALSPFVGDPPPAPHPDEKNEKEPKAAALGKKEQAQADAVAAGEGDEWGTLLNRTSTTPLQ